jgi:hypothetical protein
MREISTDKNLAARLDDNRANRASGVRVKTVEGGLPTYYVVGKNNSIPNAVKMWATVGVLRECIAFVIVFASHFSPRMRIAEESAVIGSGRKATLNQFDLRQARILFAILADGRTSVLPNQPSPVDHPATHGIMARCGQFLPLTFNRP